MPLGASTINFLKNRCQLFKGVIPTCPISSFVQSLIELIRRFSHFIAFFAILFLIFFIGLLKWLVILSLLLFWFVARSELAIVAMRPMYRGILQSPIQNVKRALD
jgi:hypothetical protein